MAKLKRDERACPICGETVKAVAVRCRFCQSELTPVPEPEPRPGLKRSLVRRPGGFRDGLATRATEDSDAASSPQTDRPGLRKWLTVALATLVLLATVGVGFSWWRAEQGSADVAPGGSLVSDDARTQVLIEAADLTQRTLSYDHKSLENDMELARARMTPTFRKEYDGTMQQVRANTEKNKIVLKAVAVSSAIIKATEHRATVLVFMNQTTTANGKNEQLNRNSLVVTLTRGDGDWAMSKLSALG